MPSNENQPRAPRIRLGLDGAATVFDYPPGVRRVVTSLLPRLAAAGHVPLVPAADEPERRWRHRELPRLERDLGLDGILSFTSAFPLRGRGLRIQTLHELPWRHGVQENAGLGHRLWARHGRRRAALVLVPSVRVLMDLEDFAPAAARRAAVLPWGVGEPFTLDEDPLLADAEILARLGLEPGRPFVLVPGGTRPKKRVDAVLQGLAGLGKQDLDLVVTGRATGQITDDLRVARTLGLEHALRYLGPVEDVEMAALYRSCHAVCVLSDSEGFGFGALEGLAAGAPVLVPPATAQAEVAGDFALQVHSGDLAGIGAALAGVLERHGTGPEAEQRARRRSAAAARTWKATAEGLQAHLESLL
ncbi:MAG: glycosyltransferase [Planctomycetota bacterium]|nr:glycosyltransferase [Planctomycetota bacterium]